MNDSNNPFPLLYHTHHQNFSDDLPFWQSLARWQGNPILELGCGTGRVLIPLAQAGHTVYGIDNAPDMLAFLNQQVTPELQSNLHVTEGDMTNFKIDTQFRLVILPCNTYSTFDAETRSAMLACIFEHLVPGGVFGVSMPNPNLLQALKDSTSEPALETIFSHPETGYPVQVGSRWERKGDVLSFIWHYDHLLPDGQIERITASTDHQLATVEQYITEMLTAGFTIRSTYRNFETGPYKPDSNYLIILAQK
jgi:SAM-dependent methyltransferase